MDRRTVSRIVYADEHPMGPMTIRQPLPSGDLPYLDPFVLLHHAPPRVMDGVRGVDAHPHRGFAPVSFIFTGGIRHRDSLGNDSTVTAGGTQWMHAGRGVVHEEIPLAGELELIQLWVNTPAARKLDPPTYFPLQADKTPQHRSDDRLATVHLVAGNLANLRGPVPTLSPINAATLDLKRGGRLQLELPRSHNASVYLLDGALDVGAGEPATGFRQVVFNTDGDGIELQAVEDTRALLITGEPIGESIVSHGPFVMNTEDEIRQAFRDYREGRMGVIRQP